MKLLKLYTETSTTVRKGSGYRPVCQIGPRMPAPYKRDAALSNMYTGVIFYLLHMSGL
jgi:hypothetical protein